MFLLISYIYRAQPDWVEAAGEHPPLMNLYEDGDEVKGSLPPINVNTIPKPLNILKKESDMRIGPGSKEQNENLISEKEYLKLKKPKKDPE